MLIVPTRLLPVAAEASGAGVAAGAVALGAAGRVASALPAWAMTLTEKANTTARGKYVNLLFMGLVLNSLQLSRNFAQVFDSLILSTHHSWAVIYAASQRAGQKAGQLPAAHVEHAT